MNNELMVQSSQATYFRKLVQICGYVANSSGQIVTISQDDATNTYHIEVKGYGMGAAARARKYFG